MFQRKKLTALDDYFGGLNQRGGNYVYFYRFLSFNSEVDAFLVRYYEEARKSGVIIEGGIPNPDKNNLSYYYEIMGEGFSCDQNFIDSSLKKWLPRMNDSQRRIVSGSVYSTLCKLRNEGKNDNMLKNAYVKFMCWMYYKFERILSKLGSSDIPKVLYEGNVGYYELLLISILSGAGCDVVFLQYSGDEGYLKHDPGSALSDKLVLTSSEPFPADYSLKKVRDKIARQFNMERICGTPPKYSVQQNTWLNSKGFKDALTPITSRGSTEKLNTVFYRIRGVEDRLVYQNELLSFSSEIRAGKRQLFILENTIPVPTSEEIAGVKRNNYSNAESAISDLSKNIVYAQNNDLQQLMKYEFIKLFLAEADKKDSVNKLVNSAVYVLCWLKRYQNAIFGSWKHPEISCVVMLGGCDSENEALFIRLLSRLPADVLVLVPNLNKTCVIADNNLKEIAYSGSMELSSFPDSSSSVSVGTAAFYAERDLDEIMYQDSGIYRNRQYSKASSVILKTMYEEIAILWNQELKYRPSFSIENDEVKVPVIFAKVSGIKDRNVNAYWQGIKPLLTEDTILWKAGRQTFDGENPVKAQAVSFFKNGKLQKTKIKESSVYQYGMLRDEIQDHILNKLQLLIDNKIIKGTMERGTEYTIISVILNLDKDIVRKIQNFDFTKKNPKFVYINASENPITIEEAIIIEFLSLVGFDVVFFVPTGYQSVETHYTRNILEEYQVGDYVYDLQVPDFSKIQTNSRPKWRERLFRRGV